MAIIKNILALPNTESPKLKETVGVKDLVRELYRRLFTQMWTLFQVGIWVTHLVEYGHYQFNDIFIHIAHLNEVFAHRSGLGSYTIRKANDILST